MPTYEYQCTKCENVFELWQSVGEAAPPCPQCAAQEVKKVFHPPRVHFKGSGFYLTDLRAEKEKATSGASGGNGAAAEKVEAGKAETGTESKTETKSETPAATPAKTEPAAARTDSAAKPATK